MKRSPARARRPLPGAGLPGPRACRSSPPTARPAAPPTTAGCAGPRCGPRSGRGGERAACPPVTASVPRRVPRPERARALAQPALSGRTFQSLRLTAKPKHALLETLGGNTKSPLEGSTVTCAENLRSEDSRGILPVSSPQGQRRGGALPAAAARARPAVRAPRALPLGPGRSEQARRLHSH